MDLTFGKKKWTFSELNPMRVPERREKPKVKAFVLNWQLIGPEGVYLLTSEYRVAGIDFMKADPVKQQGVGIRHRLFVIPKGSKVVYNPDTKIWFRIKVWHKSDTLSIISDGNCFYFMGKFPQGMSYMTFVDDLPKYTIVDVDLAAKLREEVSEGLEKADVGWEDI
jgi:hypothetical protein